MIVVSPGAQRGGNSTSLVEFVDIYPTLADAAGLPVPELCPDNSTHVAVCTEGTSLLPLLHEPARAWKNGSFSQWPKGGDMGCSIHSDHYRYTEWVEYDHSRRVPLWDKLKGVELYAHDTDVEENYNLANNGDKRMAEVQAHLQQRLHAGWRHALPQGFGSGSGGP